MHSSDIIHLDKQGNTLAGLTPWAQTACALAGAGLLLVGLLVGWLQHDGFTHFWHSYLVGFAFFASLSLGALFFVLLQHACRAGWSVAVRRVAEVMAANILLVAILFVPIALSLLFGSTALYEWLDQKRVAADHVLQAKQVFLNLPFFLLRTIAYFGVWIWLARFLWQRSIDQDTSGDPDLSLKMERVSYPGLIVFSLTITYAAFDWLMSMTPHWYSTIYGVYYLSGSIVGSLAAIILVLMGLEKLGRMREVLHTEHYHELGKLLFGFIVFWGYIAFSQYMLIWYANIPEETAWYLPRQQGPWIGVSLCLLFGHLLIPFFGMMSREVKRRKVLLGFWAIWMLVAHWLDMFYLVMPQVESSGLPLGLVDLCCFVGIGVLYVAGLLWLAADRSLVPLRDPRLGESLGFENM